MKAHFVVPLAGLALLAGGFLVFGDLGGAPMASSPAVGSAGLVRPAAANERTVTLRVDGMYCPSCPYIVRRSLAAVPGVRDVSVSYRNKTAVVTFDETLTNVAALTGATTEMGYPSKPLATK